MRLTHLWNKLWPQQQRAEQRLQNITIVVSSLAASEIKTQIQYAQNACNAFSAAKEHGNAPTVNALRDLSDRITMSLRAIALQKKILRAVNPALVEEIHQRHHAEWAVVESVHCEIGNAIRANAQPEPPPPTR